MTMGSFIRTQRLAKGLSQLQVANHLGYSSSMTVSLIEAGKMKIPVKAIPKICKILGISERAIIQFFIDEFTSNLRKEIEGSR